MLVWPPKSQTWNLMFLYVTVSTLKPMAASKDLFQDDLCHPLIAITFAAWKAGGDRNHQLGKSS